MRIDNPDFHAAGTLTGTRRNITKVTKCGFHEQLWIADGKLFTTKGGHGNVSYTSVSSATGTAPAAFRRGVEQMWEIAFPPTETGKLADADVYDRSAWALFDNGNLYTWGVNAYGQLGLGDSTDRYVPTLSNTGVTKVYSHISNSQRSGDTHRLFILKAGEVWGCGYNAFGALGDGTTTNRLVWTKITNAGTNPKSVWNLGNYTGCLIVQKSDNTIFVCGYNGYGQLGLNNTTGTIVNLTNASTAWNGGDNTMIIQDVQAGFGYNDFSNQYEHTNITMFLDSGTSSRIASCGSNSWGSLGDNSTTQRQVPVVPTGFSGRVQKMVSIGDGPRSIWVLKTDGTLWNWGYNGLANLGRGDYVDKPLPAQVMSGVSDIQESFAAGQQRGYYGNTPYVLKTDGSWWQGGKNDFGQVGDSTLTDRTSLVQMWFPAGTVIKLWGTHNTTSWGGTRFAVTDDNRIYAWGYNENYSIHEVNTSNFPIPIVMNPSILQR